jgi:hypothetical protein
MLRGDLGDTNRLLDCYRGWNYDTDGAEDTDTAENFLQGSSGWDASCRRGYSLVQAGTLGIGEAI